MTSAEDGGAETTQYLILQGPDDGESIFDTAIFFNYFFFFKTFIMCIFNTGTKHSNQMSVINSIVLFSKSM